MQIQGLTGRNKVGAIALGIAALAVGGVFLAFGLALLIAVVVVGAALGAALILYRRLTGRGVPWLGTSARASRLDPANEVFPADGSGGRFEAVSSQGAPADEGRESRE